MIRAAAPHPGARILGLGAHRPERVVDNAELCASLDTSDTWIRERTGIERRYVAAPDESVVTMATVAAGKALASAGIRPDEVDLVLVATCTHPDLFPGASPRVAAALGTTAGAVDVGAACAGFCYALAQASDAVRAGSARHVLVAGAERLTDVADPRDRATRVLFGDGAGAVVVGPSDEPEIGPVAWGSDGLAAHLIRSEPSVLASAPPYLRMEGPALFRWAVTQVAPVARRACELAGVDPSHLAAFVPHQANLRIVDAVASALALPSHVVVSRDVVDTGNTSAASVPLALTRLVESGVVRSGDAALLVAFGAGLTYAAQVVLLP